MIKTIVFLPLIGFLIASVLNRLAPPRWSEVITTGFMLIAAVLSWLVFIEVGYKGYNEKITLLPWIQAGSMSVSWSIRLDTLTAVMLVVVNTVSSLVHLYSIGYMHEDEHRPRFFAYLSLFTFAMLMLVTANDLLQLFFGWEGVGLASYLLIGFWFKKESANNAAMKAFIVNRVGDFGFALGIFAIYKLTGSIEFDTIFKAANSLVGKQLLGYDALTVTCLLLFMGAMGKSAQFLLHTWLPDAMEGPTPVSALIHAATMVTAGVFMVARLSPLFELAPNAQAVVMFIGATTAFFAGTVGLVQNDIKRIIAYSTCSQLGFMFVALGAGAYSIAVFHLFTHAFFKALLFLGAGSVIHACHHEQDIRHMGGLWRKIPFTYAMMTIGTLALTGFWFTAGYFSKDAVIEAAYVAHNPFAAYAFILTVITAGMTSFYSWRLVFKTFHGEHHQHGDHVPHESPVVMLVPLAVLAFGAIFAGLAFKGVFIGDGYEAFWRGAVTVGKDNHVLHDIHKVPAFVPHLPGVMMVIGFLIAYWMYIKNPKLPHRLATDFQGLYQFFLNKWYFDEAYDFLFVRPAKRIGHFLWKKGDGWLIDGFGPDGIAALTQRITARAVKLQSGYLYHYAFAMMIGLAAFITYFTFKGGAH
jgi:NADH-quinone oxidoreductase subunit L